MISVGLDGRNLGLDRGTGIATYTGMLGRTLPACGVAVEVLGEGERRARPWRWAMAAVGAAGSRVGPVDGAGWATRQSPDVFRVGQVHFDMWGRLLPVRGRGLPDLMHWTCPLPLRLVGRPNVVTIHDLIPWLHPELTGTNSARFRRMVTAVARNAAHVLTGSDAARAELIQTLGLDRAKVTNTGHGVEVGGATTRAAGLELGEYWLHVGAVERRKNLLRLIAAWQASGTAYPLVLAGPDGWHARETLDVAAPFLSGEAERRIIRLEWLDRGSLLATIRDARGLLMPSLAEGFGLPVAEALALGTPVLTSSRGALAEVAGDAAVLVDPLDGDAMASGLRALDGDAALRERLAAAGPVRARAFTPEACAERVAALYRQVLEAHHSATPRGD